MKQGELIFEVHDRENNQASETFLNENRQKFTDQCAKVYQLLKSGVRLTTINSRDYRILSLPRRIKDLKENGIEINERWIKNSEGGKGWKEWFI